MGWVLCWDQTATCGWGPTYSLLVDLTQRLRLSYVFISHDLNVVRFISDRVLVMGHGHIVFSGSVADFRADDQIRRQWLEVN